MLESPVLFIDSYVTLLFKILNNNFICFLLFLNFFLKFSALLCSLMFYVFNNSRDVWSF